MNSFYSKPDFNDDRLTILMNESEFVSLADFKEKWGKGSSEFETLKSWVGELKNTPLILFTAPHSIKISNIYVPATDEQLYKQLQAPKTSEALVNVMRIRQASTAATASLAAPEHAAEATASIAAPYPAARATLSTCSVPSVEGDVASATATVPLISVSRKRSLPQPVGKASAARKGNGMPKLHGSIALTRDASNDASKWPATSVHAGTSEARQPAPASLVLRDRKLLGTPPDVGQPSFATPLAPPHVASATATVPRIWASRKRSQLQTDDKASAARKGKGMLKLHGSIAISLAEFLIRDASDDASKWPVTSVRADPSETIEPAPISPAPASLVLRDRELPGTPPDVGQPASTTPLAPPQAALGPPALLVPTAQTPQTPAVEKPCCSTPCTTYWMRQIQLRLLPSPSETVATILAAATAATASLAAHANASASGATLVSSGIVSATASEDRVSAGQYTGCTGCTRCMKIGTQ